MKVGIINYGMGNLASVRRAFQDVGADAFVAEHPASLYDAHRIVLPGVGAFGEGMERLRAGGWVESLRNFALQGTRPILGICLGMQMLATEGEEGGLHEGLGLVDGRVRRLDALGCELRVPHVGWNEVTFRKDDALFAHISPRTDFYFVHSFAVTTPSDSIVTANTNYGVAVVAAVRNGIVFGTQFHPEKSSRAGRRLLQNFLDFRVC